MKNYQYLTCVTLVTIAVVACGSDESSGPVSISGPQVDQVSSPTNENPILITGVAEPGAEVQIRGGAEPVASAEADAEGAFEASVELKEDAENALLISQIVGESESEGTMLVVVHDGTAPDTPKLDSVASPTRRPQVTLTGSAEPGALISVTGGAEGVSNESDASGRFSILVTLQTSVGSISENMLSVVATDAAGNVSTAASATVIHNPNIDVDPPVVDVAPSHTNQAMLTLTGATEASLTVSVTGGDAPVTVTAGEDGRFEADVELKPNAENNLNVFAIIVATGKSSPPSPLTVIHDDIAPEAPQVDPVGSPTGAETVQLVGRTEALAMLAVSGGASPAMGDADLDGVFSIEVQLNADATNELSIESTDFAGNRSAATELVIDQDSTLEEPVFVDNVASPTSDNPVTISGSTEASTDVVIEGGASTVMIQSEANGSFSASVTLNENARNELRVRRAAGSVETVVVIEHDDQSPSAPGLDALASPTNQTEITVSGNSEAFARIAISGAVSAVSGRANDKGRFSLKVMIPEDETTTLSVIATDRAGNASAPNTVIVAHSSEVPNAPILDEQSPAPTHEATYIVSGRIEPAKAGVTIKIGGGSALATGPTDESTGAFSVEVTLNENADNILEVASVDGAIESPAATVTITHDNVAPAAPDTSKITVGSPTVATCLVRSESINVTGGNASVEANARVRVRNMTEGSLMVAVDADANGAFSTSLFACDGDRLEIVASDSAGNEGTGSEVTVEM